MRLLSEDEELCWTDSQPCVHHCMRRHDTWTENLEAIWFRQAGNTGIEIVNKDLSLLNIVNVLVGEA